MTINTTIHSAIITATGRTDLPETVDCLIDTMLKRSADSARSAGTPSPRATPAATTTPPKAPKPEWSSSTWTPPTTTCCR